jgi:hypothetical protein
MATLRPTTRLRAVSAPTVAILAVTGTETFQAGNVWRNILNYTSRKRRPRARPEAAFEGKARYLLIL